MRKPTFWFPNWFEPNQAVQLQKMARGLKLRIKKENVFYYLCSENKVAASLFSHIQNVGERSLPIGLLVSRICLFCVVCNMIAICVD